MEGEFRTIASLNVNLEIVFLEVLISEAAKKYICAILRISSKNISFDTLIKII